MPSLQRPPDLRELQDAFYRVFTSPHGARAASADRPEVLSWIQDAPPLDRESRLSVYGDAYFQRLLEALSSDHLAVRRALGERDFQVLSAEYFATHPPTSPSLADLGERFPAFVAAHRFSRRRLFLPDLARLERAMLTALLTDRLPALDPAALGGWQPDAWDRSRLIFDPTVRLLQFGWPVERLWRARHEPLDASNRRLRRPREHRLIVWRDSQWVRLRELSKAEAAFLERALAGVPLGELFAGVQVSARPADVRRWFARWISDALVKQVVPDRAGS